MNFTLTYKIVLLLLLISFASCSNEKEISQDYKIINTVLDSLVKLSRKDSIGLQTKTLNNSWLSKELLINPGFFKYENGTLTNKCLENNIRSERFSNFNYEVFKANDNALDTLKILNNRITTNFELKSTTSQERLQSLWNKDSNLQKEDLEKYLWEIERYQSIYQVSQPIFSDNSKIAVLLVHARNFGLQSWTLKVETSGELSIFCVEQISIE